MSKYAVALLQSAETIEEMAGEIAKLEADRDKWMASSLDETARCLKLDAELATSERGLFAARVVMADWEADLFAADLKAKTFEEGYEETLAARRYLESKVAKLEAACREQTELAPERTVPSIWEALKNTEVTDE